MDAPATLGFFRAKPGISPTYGATDYPPLVDASAGALLAGFFGPPHL